MIDIDTQARAWLSRYVAGEIDLDEFAGWFAGAAWGAESELVNDIALSLAEGDRGDLNPPEVRAHFASLVGQTVFLEGSLSLSGSQTAALVAGSAHIEDQMAGLPAAALWQADEQHATGSIEARSVSA